jgi:hypothetical protein
LIIIDSFHTNNPPAKIKNFKKINNLSNCWLLADVGIICKSGF